MKRLLTAFLSLFLIIALLTGCAQPTEAEPSAIASQEASAPYQAESSQAIGESQAPQAGFDLSSVPEFSGEPFAVINGNVPFFTEEELTDSSFEFYSELDSLGRCGVVYASVGRDLMPTEERGEIGMVKPTGWHTVRYDFVDGKYLYNRCHLIGWQLTGENANRSNLITGTRYMNVQGMLPFENMIADYIKETENHVYYRVTPIFSGDELLARGVLMEAVSVEDGGEGICFNVFCYNAQEGVSIDYATGKSELAGQSGSESSQPKPETVLYILNTNTKKFHLPSCSSCGKIAEKNYKEQETTRDSLIAEGYAPCGLCKP